MHSSLGQETPRLAPSRTGRLRSSLQRALWQSSGSLGRTFIASTGYMTVCSYYHQQRFGAWETPVRLTAIPANPPATMFCTREKFGGRDS